MAVARSLTLYSYEDLERAASGFAPVSMLGSGRSNEVFRADLGGGARRAHINAIGSCNLSKHNIKSNKQINSPSDGFANR